MLPLMETVPVFYLKDERFYLHEHVTCDSISFVDLINRYVYQQR